MERVVPFTSPRQNEGANDMVVVVISIVINFLCQHFFSGRQVPKDTRIANCSVYRKELHEALTSSWIYGK